MQDEQFEQFVSEYPVSRRQRGFMAMHVFGLAVEKTGFSVLIAALRQHKRSEQWRTTSLIPMMLKWLEEERWIQELPEYETAPLKVGQRHVVPKHERL